MLGAGERDQQARDPYREQIAGRNAGDFVIVDECGSNINPRPVYARTPNAVTN